MDTSQIFDLPNEVMWNVIRRKYKEDPDEVKELIEKFREWLNHHPCLPQDVDEHLIENFIRHQECNLEKAKGTFERYVVYRSALRNLLPDRDFDEDYFKNSVHRNVEILKKLTPEGYRIGYLKVPKDINRFSFENLVHYISAIADLALLFDSVAGYVGIYDFQDISLDRLSEIDIKVFEEFAEMLYNTLPLRIINIHFLNVSTIPEPLQCLLEKHIGPELLEKVRLHEDPSKLKGYLPEDMISKEYGGTLVNLEELSENFKKFFIQSKDFARKTANLKVSQDFLGEKSD